MRQKSLKNRRGEEQHSFLNVFIISNVPRLARVRCSPFVATSKLSFVEKINPKYLYEFTTSKNPLLFDRQMASLSKDHHFSLTQIYIQVSLCV